MPLRNQLKFSLYGPAGDFRGRWDSPQHFGKWVTIGQTSSRGFKQQLLTPGQWTLEIELHGVFSPEVNVTLELATATLDKGARSQWYAGELHTHTNPDGNASLEEVAASADKAGLDFIVLSDHNTISAWQDINGNLPVKVIKGLELSSYFGHLVAAGIKDYIDWRTTSPADTLEKPLEEIKAQGGLAIIAHPFEAGAPLCCGCEWEYSNVDLSHIDALEIWSGTWQGSKAISNWCALVWWDHLLNAGYQITGVAARDVHQLGQFENPDTANTYVKSTSLNTGELLAAIRHGRVFLSSGPQLEMELCSENAVYSFGDIILEKNDGTYKLDVQLTEITEPLLYQVVANGKIIHEEPVYGDHFQSARELKITKGWVRVQFQKSQTPEFVAIGNPIYIS